MEVLINDIVSYLEYINSNCGISVSVHFKNEFLFVFPKDAMNRLMHYNSHRNPYCLAVKKCNHKKCISEQKSIIKEHKEKSFLRVCYAGVCEYIFPIIKNDESVGYVAVSGYRKEIPEKVMFPLLWESSLKSEEPPLKLCNMIIPPLVTMLEKLFSSSPREKHSEYNMILQFLNEYHTNITLSDICSQFKRSPSYISHMFKKESGMNIREYCNSRKLEDAEKLLISTDMSITEIALDTGFGDSSYFIALFRKKYGISPLKYRKEKGQK